MKLIFLINIIFVQPSFATLIDGYTNKLSAFPSDSVELYLNASASAQYPLKLYDLSGKELFQISIRVFPQHIINDNPYENGYGYKLTKKVCVPELPSGVYLWDNKIPFIIKARSARITVVYSSNTINAYCNSGGKSLYPFNSTERTAAQKVSFLRPMSMSRHSEAFLHWMHKESVKDVAYISDSDLEDYGSIKKSQLIIIAGHSEYWTLQARKNFDRFVHEGKNALVLSGNTMWWQVRYNKSKDQMICYRNAKTDPLKTEQLKTVNWSEPELHYPIYNSIGTDFRNAGYGLRADRGWDGYKLLVNSPLLEGTALKAGDIIKCPSDEVDGVPLATIENDTPVIDYQTLNFSKVEIVGYDLVSRAGKEGVATWIVFQPTQSSGIVINTASTDWCSANGIGSNGDIQRITATMIRKLTHNEAVFSSDVEAVTLVN